MLEKDVNRELWDAGRWEESVRAVFRKSLEDPAFRKTAIADPQKAIEIATGRPAPDNLKLSFVEKLEEKTFVLPQSDAPASQLSEVDISRILYHCYRSQSLLPDPA